MEYISSCSCYNDNNDTVIISYANCLLLSHYFKDSVSVHLGFNTKNIFYKLLDKDNNTILNKTYSLDLFIYRIKNPQYGSVEDIYKELKYIIEIAKQNNNELLNLDNQIINAFTEFYHIIDWEYHLSNLRKSK